VKVRIAALTAAFAIGVMAFVAAVVVLVVGGYEADLHPPAGDDWRGWALLGAGVLLMTGSFTAIVISLAVGSRRHRGR
jgi:hypothetical protein